MNVVFGNGNVGRPAVVKACFSPGIDDPVLEKIIRIGICGSIGRRVVSPMILMAFAFSVDQLKTSRAAHGTDLVDPLNRNPVESWLADVKYRAKIVDLRLFLQSSLEGQKRGGPEKTSWKSRSPAYRADNDDLSGLARIIDLPDTLSDGGS